MNFFKFSFVFLQKSKKIRIFGDKMITYEKSLNKVHYTPCLTNNRSGIPFYNKWTYSTFNYFSCAYIFTLWINSFYKRYSQMKGVEISDFLNEGGGRAEWKVLYPTRGSQLHSAVVCLVQIVLHIWCRKIWVTAEAIIYLRSGHCVCLTLKSVNLLITPQLDNLSRNLRS